MAKTVIPDALKRRHLMEQEADEQQSLALAEAYLEAGRVQEAISFLAKAGATTKLEDLADRAVAEGDAFLLKQIGDLLVHEYESATWLSLANAAEAKGKLLYAEAARRQARTSEA